MVLLNLDMNGSIRLVFGSSPLVLLVLVGLSLVKVCTWLVSTSLSELFIFLSLSIFLSKLIFLSFGDVFFLSGVGMLFLSFNLPVILFNWTGFNPAWALAIKSARLGWDAVG